MHLLRARRAVRRLQPFFPECGRGVLVLAYHLVGAGTGSPVDVPPALFRAHLRQLAREAQVLSLSDAAGRLASGRALSPCAAVLTFDDAYENFYTRVFPLLQEYRLPATLYVPTHFIEQKGPQPIAGTDGLRACSWEQLQEMQASGLVAIGSHTRTHPSLPQVSPRRARWEIETSKALLQERLGARVKSFCYPRALWTQALDRVVQATYETAVIGGGAKPRPQRFRLHRLQRVSIRRDAPHSLKPLLESCVWLEEWLADQVRHLRP